MFDGYTCTIVWQQVRSIIDSLKLGVTVIMLDMDTSPNEKALFPAPTVPDADLRSVAARAQCTVLFVWCLRVAALSRWACTGTLATASCTRTPNRDRW